MRSQSSVTVCRRLQVPLVISSRYRPSGGHELLLRPPQPIVFERAAVSSSRKGSSGHWPKKSDEFNTLQEEIDNYCNFLVIKY